MLWDFGPKKKVVGRYLRPSLDSEDREGRKRGKEREGGYLPTTPAEGRKKGKKRGKTGVPSSFSMESPAATYLSCSDQGKRKGKNASERRSGRDDLPRRKRRGGGRNEKKKNSRSPGRRIRERSIRGRLCLQKGGGGRESGPGRRPLLIFDNGEEEKGKNVY